MPSAGWKTSIQKWLSKIAPSLFVACSACGVQAPSQDMNAAIPVVAGATSTAPIGTGGASGRPASAGGVAGSATAPRAVSGVAGSSTLPPTMSVAGAMAGAANAGSGAKAPVAGAGGKAGGAGAAGSSVASAGAAGAGANTSADGGCKVAPISMEMRGRYKNMDNDYYQKYADALGVIVATGPEVSDEALLRYCLMMSEFVSNEQVRKAIIDDKMWFTMIDEKEQLSDLPQIARDYGTSLNQRARGLGGLTPTICAEDSIMCLPGDRWKGDCICPHETGHTLYSSGIAKVRELSDRLTSITRDARSSGRLANAYVWMDGNESGMMAWGVQVWYDCAINGTNGGYHSDINTRAELQKEMPDFYEFLSELLPQENQYKDCYAK